MNLARRNETAQAAKNVVYKCE